MKTPAISKAIALCGTDQPDPAGRMLRAGPMSVEFDNGQLRYLKVNGVEVLRAVGFLVRDENWGTYTSAISNLKIDQRADSFSVSFHAVCRRPDQEIAYEARIEGTRDGNLVFDGTAIPKTDFKTARTGFVVLHPLKGVAGYPATPLSGCSTTNPVRAVLKSVLGMAVPSKTRFPSLVPSILASYAISWSGRLHTAWKETEKLSARWSIFRLLM